MASLNPEDVRHRSTRLGYYVLYNEDYSRSEYEHRFIMEQHLGRPLRRDEVVHHIDRDRKNNDISNLVLLSRSEHTALHWDEDGRKPNANRPVGNGRCIDCGKPISRKAIRCVRCSHVLQRKVEWPSYEQLLEDVRTLPMTRVGEKYGVSDKAVGKWLKHYRSMDSSPSDERNQSEDQGE